MYKVVPIHEELVGGHYAVEGPDGKIIGKEFRLDLIGANKLLNALSEAYSIGRASGNGFNPLLRGPQMAREGQNGS
jgi:hypothetical protein